MGIGVCWLLAVHSIQFWVQDEDDEACRRGGRDSGRRLRSLIATGCSCFRCFPVSDWRSCVHCVPMPAETAQQQEQDGAGPSRRAPAVKAERGAAAVKAEHGRKRQRQAPRAAAEEEEEELIDLTNVRESWWGMTWGLT